MRRIPVRYASTARKECPNHIIFGRPRDVELTVNTKYTKVTLRNPSYPACIRGCVRGVIGMTTYEYLIGRDTGEVEGENGARKRALGIPHRGRDIEGRSALQGEANGALNASFSHQLGGISSSH